jgi:hypothetical protein
MHQWKKGKGCSLSGTNLAPRADSFNVANGKETQLLKFKRN